ncbi:MAG: magnesium-translocating P-type ATPase [Ignavibacteriaceae bacterium]|nr:magnesium-translocating P-type ATPase [Ignavibacteriaceae bacterium]
MNLSKPGFKEVKTEKNNSRFFQQLSDISRKGAFDVLAQLGTSLNGLNPEAVEDRIEKYGYNEITHEKERGWLWRLLLASKNPLVILLLVLATIAFLTEDIRSGIVMTLMVILGVTLRFIQETKADNAAAKLKAMINVTATVIRDGIQEEIELKNLVPGDIIKLSAGDMIPADVRIISAKDLFIIQASLTGESMPVEKYDTIETRGNISPIELTNIAYLGTSVESGSSTAVVVTTGSQTYFGSMAKTLAGQEVQTSFDKGVNRFTWLMIQFMIIMVPLVFLINGFTKHNWIEAFFFALAIAVGLTPEMLPMIVSVSLSKGAILMSKKKVIVKRLNAIQNFGAMNILCADKTGTLTIDKVILEHHCDVVNEEDDSVLLDAYLISHFQTGLKNVLDRAILHQSQVIREISIGQFQKIDEIPFDFSRRLMSVVVKEPEGSCRLLTKGAPEEIFKRCTRFELHNEILPMDPILIQDLKEEYEELSTDGFRVLALAYKDMEHKTSYTKNDETDLVLKGYVAFLDPPKETAAPAILALQKHGVAVKILTGDNDLVTKKICFEVGLPTDRILLGNQVENMDDDALAKAAGEVAVFARLSPSHKERIVRVLRAKGNVVGFMGDGINDAPALRAADVGISVDTAVDIAKESADVILLEKSLMVLEEGVLEGRKVFVNILKYVRMGASSNFGNMFSVLGASAFLPFVPMAPIQILTNNLLYDFSQVPIPTDDVDPEQITKPRPWNISEIKRFILFIGPISSIFDYTTYFIMLYIFDCWDPSKASLFQTGWFVESLMTQTLIIHVIRTNKIPFIQSRPSWPLIVTTVLVMAFGMILPFSPLAKPLGFEQLPALYWPLLAATLLCYITVTQFVKTLLLRKNWI